MINQDTIVFMAREAGMSSLSLIDIGYLEKFAALVAASEREAIESALTDPENQPSQWGTVTIEHMEQQVAAEREACLAKCKFGRTSADIEISVLARSQA